jgi:D-alanine-D-alanine ligase
MKKRKRVAVIFGGRSGEHVVSLRSASSIMEAIDQDQYEIVPVGITKEGSWLTGPDAWLSLWEKRRPEKASATALVADPTRPGLLIKSPELGNGWSFEPIDLAFPVLHGTFGEDGTIQGLFEMAGLPYVGSGVLASSTGMDKAVMKLLFREAGLPVAPYLVLDRDQWFSRQDWWLDQVREKLGYPAFVKPSNLGSSVGISKAYNPEELIAAVEEALRYDYKLLIEQYVAGREIECGVIGNRAATASRPGEVIPCNDFYDYRAKYLDDRSGLVVPVELGPELENMIKDYSVRAFQAIEADGLARVDFFLSKSDHRIIVNEINTMPGFTSISMYPKMFEASGLDYNALVDRLLELAEERHQNRQSLLFAPPE